MKYTRIFLIIGIISLLLISFVSAAEWSAGTYYSIGDQVTYQGVTYECIQAHTAQVGWEPPNVPALWNVVETPVNEGIWTAGVSYSIGDKVEYSGHEYICRQSHTAQSDWTPDVTPALWEKNIDSTYENTLIAELEQKYADKLGDYSIVAVDKSVKIITYHVTLQDSQGNIKNMTWMDAQ